MRIVSALAALALAVQPGTAAAMAEPRAPAGKWRVDFSETQCVALLPFGEQGELEYLAIKPLPTGTHVTFAMIVDGRKRAPEVRNYSLEINGVEQPSQLLFYGTSAQKRVYRYLVNMPVRQLARIERLKLSFPGKDFDLAVTQMDGIASLLDQCMDDLRDYWNIDNGKVAAGPTLPVDLPSLFSPEDYPKSAWLAGESGVARAFLLVDTDGKVVDCAVSAYVGAIILANQLCAVVSERAKFEPARDAQGNVIRSSFCTSPARFQIAGRHKTAEKLNEEFRQLEGTSANCPDP